mmetsp:Transcript_25545/g.70515  ORF Transcript_25545/g.70515 Transcript_25545/m.70515 type:complete len:461 (-) Transcript_25545:1264-2646(-)
MTSHGLSSGYCELAGAKSTIALAFSADGTRFASTHGDHTVKVFDSDTWSLRAVLAGHERTPWTVKFHPHSRRILASGSLDQSVRVWDIERGECIALHHFLFVVSCISFHPTGRLIAVTSGKRISVWRWYKPESRADTPESDGEGASDAEAMEVDALSDSERESSLGWREILRLASVAETSPAVQRQRRQSRPMLVRRECHTTGPSHVPRRGGGGGGGGIGRRSWSGAGSSAAMAAGASASTDLSAAATAGGRASAVATMAAWAGVPSMPMPTIGSFLSGGLVAPAPASRLSAPGAATLSNDSDVCVVLEGDHPQRCVAFKRSSSHEMFFVAETNDEPPPRLPAHQHMVPPFTVQLWMWLLPIGHDYMSGDKCDPSNASFHIQRSVMYSDAGFDVSKCGRFLALCELDATLGYSLKTCASPPPPFQPPCSLRRTVPQPLPPTKSYRPPSLLTTPRLPPTLP